MSAMRSTVAAALGALLACSACQSAAPGEHAAPTAPIAAAPAAAPHPSPAPAAPAPVASEREPEPGSAPELFGAPFASDVPSVPLAALIEDPGPYAGKIVETTGKVSQVCQMAGCWMELSAAGTDQRVRTPMAGHAFFLPKTVVGKEARVQGRVELIALSEQAKRHLEAEGAQATSSTLSLSALSVAVR